MERNFEFNSTAIIVNGKHYDLHNDYKLIAIVEDTYRFKELLWVRSSETWVDKNMPENLKCIIYDMSYYYANVVLGKDMFLEDIGFIDSDEMEFDGFYVDDNIAEDMHFVFRFEDSTYIRIACKEMNFV